MWLKIIICYFFCITFFFADAQNAHKDSIGAFFISDQLERNEATKQASLKNMPYRFFDTNQLVVYLSYEFIPNTSNPNTTWVVMEIKKKSTQQMRLRPLVSKKVEMPKSNTSVYIDSLRLTSSSFVSGNYEILVHVMTDSLRIVQTKKIDFQLLRNPMQMSNSEVPEEEIVEEAKDTDIDKSFVAKYPIEILQKNIQTLEPIAKKVEKQVIKELIDSKDKLTMQRFFYNFWYQRNAGDPEKAWNEYVFLLNEVAKKYGTSSTAGYETDRGQIYIKYGVPDKIERILNEKGALPYECWSYNTIQTKNNIRFLFYQPGILSNQMVLLHSNFSDELMNPYWKEVLLDNPNDGDNKLIHRVFEYFQ